jgi:parallel beta-helix repeat protein
MSDNNYIANCTGIWKSISYGWWGFDLSESNDNFFEYNDLNGFYNGVRLHFSNRNKFIFNNIINSRKEGAWLGQYNCKDNEYYFNNFVNNSRNNPGKPQAADYGLNNIWNLTSPKKGNYWSDWVSPDNNSDGIVDKSYVLGGGKGAKDYYPMANPFNLKFNYPPTITTTNVLVCYIYQNYLVNYSANDLDTPQTQLTWTMKTNASWLKFSSTQELHGTPNSSDIGTYWVYISVYDGNQSDFTNFTLTVLKKPTPPPQPGKRTVIIVRTGQRFTKIQDAIDNASSVDTIRIWAGFYYENIILNKRLSLIGNGTRNTTIDGNNKDSVITINSPYCNVSDLSIMHGNGFSKGGIRINSDKNTIQNCFITKNSRSILFESSNYNTIKNCTLSLSYNYGVGIRYRNSSSYNHIYNNNIIDNGGVGISIDYNCNNNRIHHNNFINNSGWHNTYRFQATDLGLRNRWNTSSVGNYWWDWTSPDNNTDGIVDKPYVLGGEMGAKDYYPLAKPIPVHIQPPQKSIGRVINQRTQQKFEKIQDAIDNAIAEDTIRVYSGIFYESLILNKFIKIIGNGSNETVIKGGQDGSIISIFHDNCTLEKLGIVARIQNSDNIGIKIESNYNNITDCYINSSSIYSDGLFIKRVKGNTISNCILEGNSKAIYVRYSDNNLIKDSIVTNNYHGIMISHSEYNRISNCYGYDNNIGITISNSNYNTVIESNNSLNVKYGIFIEVKAGNNNIINNDFWNNHQFGACLGSNTSNNIFSNNNFINNNELNNITWAQTYDDGNNNKWNNGKVGNYWSEWTTPDKNNDGIVDIPYNISGSAGAKDYYPLTKRVDIHHKPTPKVLPKIITTNITNNSFNISINTTEIKITFSQPVNTTSFITNLEISPQINYSLIWEDNNYVLKIIFNEKLAFNTTYKISIDNSNLDLNSPFELVFTTEPDKKISDKGREDDEPVDYIPYFIISIIILIIVIIIVFAIITKNRQKLKTKAELQPGQLKDDRVLPTGMFDEEQSTDQDSTKELIDDLKDKAMSAKKPSEFGTSKEMKLKKVQDKYQKGEISKETYHSILDIINKKNY